MCSSDLGGADFAGVYGPYTPTSCDGYQYQERNQKDVSAEVRFTSPQDQALRWIAGAYTANIKREVVVAYGADQGLGFDRKPYVPATGPNPTDLLFWDQFDTRVYAAFGQLEFNLSDTQELAFAARFDQEKREVGSKVPNVTNSGLNVNLLVPGTFNPGPINPALVANPGGIPDRDNDFEQFQPKVTWRWDAADGLNIYASWGVGFRSGGFNSLGTEDLLNFWFNKGYGGPGEAVGAGEATAFNIYKNTLGQIVLDPVRAIPASEAWLWENPAALAAVRKGIKESSRGKTVYLGSFAGDAK